jgi:hypothetical protein
MKRYIRSGTIFLAALAASIAQGAFIFDSGVDSLNVGDPTQLGRISRNNVISDWSSAKPFPGTVNPTISYSYTTYDIPAALIGANDFIQITMDSVSGNTFAAAYFDSYDPTNESLDYLGDAGSSGNFFGTDPIALQVIVPSGADLIVLVNQAGTGGLGLGDPYDVLVEGFIDNEFDDAPPSAPEPASVILSGSGIGAGLLFAFIRRKRNSPLASK